MKSYSPYKFILAAALVSSLSLAFLAPSMVKAAESDIEKEQLDVVIVLAADVSSSVGFFDYRTQKLGIIKALRDPEVASLLVKCNSRGVGLTYIEWAGLPYFNQQKQVVAWSKLTQPEDLQTFASKISASRRSFWSLGALTDINGALTFSMNLLLQAPFSSDRKIISLSSDGYHNTPDNTTDPTLKNKAQWAADLSATRERILSQGVAINAITISDIRREGPFIYDHWNLEVIGGPGAFVIPITNFDEFGDALRAKLLRELNNCTS